jgi:hypothetical protein
MINKLLHFIENSRGVGTFISFIVVLSIPRSQVVAMLPKQLDLAPQNITPEGEHPIFLEFGEQMNVHNRELKIFHLNYLEFIVSIPYVYQTNSKSSYCGPFLFMPRLYLDKTFPIILGKLYGFAKEKANMLMSDRSYQINNIINGNLLALGEFREKEKPGSYLDYPLFNNAIAKMLQQPLIGQTSFGSFIYSVFDWNLAHAEIQPIEAEVSIVQPFLSGLSVGKYHVPGINEFPLGAFKIKALWTLTAPMKIYYPRV